MIICHNYHYLNSFLNLITQFGPAGRFLPTFTDSLAARLINQSNEPYFLDIAI